eukprot:m51a1_g11628 hypothetical protein (86) ;mRNA; f:1564-1898
MHMTVFALTFRRYAPDVLDTWRLAVPLHVDVVTSLYATPLVWFWYSRVGPEDKEVPRPEASEEDPLACAEEGRAPDTPLPAKTIV